MKTRIGPCEVDLQQRQLSVKGKAVSLSPRAWDVLEYLAINRGRLVTTEKLLELLWPGRSADETYVRKTISEIRKALNDDARAPVYVRTVPKHGYLLQADADTETQPEVSKNIAVLPFANFSDDPGLDHFCDGLTEEVLNKLSHEVDTPVIARTSSFQFKGISLDIRSIGRALDARHILEGSVRTGNNLLRVTAQLIDARTGVHSWSENYECAAGDDLKAQDELAEAISIRVRDSGQSRGSVTRPVLLSEQFLGPDEFRRLRQAIVDGGKDPGRR